MTAILASARNSALAGLFLAALMLAVWLGAAGADRIGLVSFLLRLVHVFAAMLWVGMIWFVNFIQLAAIAEVDDAARGAILRTIVPRVAGVFRRASNYVLLSGIAMLATSGYALDRLLFASAVHVAQPRAVLMLAGGLGGAAMWALVHMAIWPALRIVLGIVPGDAGAKAAAREKVRMCARLNLVLAIPVTFAMIAAAHLY